jgi:hypothetical protein
MLPTTFLPPRVGVAVRAALLVVAVLALSSSPCLAQESPTPQAVDANAEFLAYAPPPVRPGKVCVVDTGVDLTTDAAPSVEGRYSMYGGTVGDVGGSNIAKHGTYVAGVIASQLDGEGSVGIWPRARIISVRVFADGRSGTSVPAYLDGLSACADRGAAVINLSLSGLGTATGAELAALENRITDLRDFGGVNVVAAAGNTGGDLGYPAKFPASFAVGASDSTGNTCSFSARGPEVDISALGCAVTVSLGSTGQGLASGTSYATAIVSAALAALRAYSPVAMSPTSAEQLLIGSARPTPAGKAIDIARAFRAAGLESMTAAPARTTTGRSSTLPSLETVRVWSAGRSDALTDLGVRRPAVRTKSYRRGVLRIEISGVPDYGWALFTVDRRRYIRRSGRLRLRLKRYPRSVNVVVEVPEVGRTRPVRIRLQPGDRSGKGTEKR